MNRVSPATDSASTVTPSSSCRIDHGGSADEYRAAHETLKANREIWPSLSFAGLQHDGAGGLVELRHCPSCQSTLARPIAQSEALFLCESQAELAVRSKLALAEANEASCWAQSPRKIDRP